MKGSQASQRQGNICFTFSFNIFCCSQIYNSTNTITPFQWRITWINQLLSDYFSIKQTEISHTIKLLISNRISYGHSIY